MATYYLKTPISEGEIRKLRVGDIFYVTGTIVTARDQAHRRALEYFRQGKQLPINLEGLAIFHCGPVVSREGEKWIVLAAGPTTSTRMNIFEEEVIKNFKVRVIIGKGGMDERTTEAMKKYGAIYGAFAGGAGVLAAKAINRVVGVEWLDLGVPEALWIFEVENFGPLVVGIDSNGNNLYINVAKKVEENRKRIYEKLGLHILH
jgi:fumarate hydratase subunit beta